MTRLQIKYLDEKSYLLKTDAQEYRQGAHIIVPPNIKNVKDTANAVHWLYPLHD